MIECTVWKVDSDGTEEWHLNGQLHHEDGPAIVDSDGDKEWYLNGERLTEQEFNDRVNPEPMRNKYD